MASSAFGLGFQAAQERYAERQQRKQALADEERWLRVSDLYTKGNQLARLIPGLSGDDRDRAMDQLTSLEQNLASIYHPQRNPGALERDWDRLVGLIHKNPPPGAVLSKSTTPGTKETSFTLDGQQVAMPATPAYAAVSLKPQAMSPLQRQRMARQDEARKQAELDVASAGLSPQQAVADVEDKLAIAEKLPGVKMTADEKDNLRQSMLYAALGIKPTAERYSPQIQTTKDADGKEHYWRMNLNTGQLEQIGDFAGQTLAPKSESADTRKRADYLEYKKLHPEYTGTFEQWATEQSRLGQRAVPVTKDDRFIDIQQRMALGQPISKDDEAYDAAWNLYVQRRVIDPIQARAAAFSNDRYVQVMDPSDPEKVVLMHAGDAARAGAGTPASIGFQTDKAVTKYMTAGAGAQNLNYFNTAVDHLQLLTEASDALNNGDIQAANRAGNYLGLQFGDDAVTNFNAVKNAVAGELSKTFRGAGATDSEISQINQTINSSMSPDQLHGAINYYTRLMGGKLNALRAQYEAGKSGRPAFPTAAAPAGAAGAAPVRSKGPRSIGAAMKMWADRGQPKTEAWVIDDLKQHGYIPVFP